MFSLFIVLLSFSMSLALDQTKCLILNDEPCMVGATLINMNPVEFKYYSAMISLNKCTGNFDVLSSKICFQKKQNT